VDIEEFVKPLKTLVYIVYALLFAICEVCDLSVNTIGVAGGVWAWRGRRLLLGLCKECEGFGGKGPQSMLS
jgi:hypothetical protein